MVGTLDLEHALKKGEKRGEPGILAAAHRGILYVEEVNLLDDHVVDVLLDSAAMGVNTIERKGVSFSHPARFTKEIKNLCGFFFNDRKEVKAKKNQIIDKLVKKRKEGSTAVNNVLSMLFVMLALHFLVGTAHPTQLTGF